MSEDAKFCMRCGRQLTDVSIYEELLKASIDDALPLTENKVSALTSATNIRTVTDLSCFLDQESTEIRRAPYIGPIWAATIHRYADEFVSV